MVKISNRHSRFKEIEKKNETQNENKKYFYFRRIDRSRYPKSTFWIIFAAAGAFLLWMIVKFFLLLTK